MADVGDRHQQAPAALGGLGEHGIVEVARVLAVDRHERHVAQVDARAEALGLDGLAVAPRLAQHGRRELVWQLVRGDRELDRGLRHALLRQHAGDAADRLGVPARRLDDLGDDQAAVGRAALVARRDHDALADAAVVGRDEADAALEVEAAGDLARAALEHLDDLAFLAVAAIDADDPHRDAVAVHDAAHLRWREEGVVGAVVGNEEAEAVAVAGDLAGADRQPVEQQELVAAVSEQLAVAGHCAEALLERGLKALVLELERVGEAVGGLRGAGFAQDLEQVFPARDGARVLLGLGGLVGIGASPVGVLCHLVCGQGPGGARHFPYGVCTGPMWGRKYLIDRG